MAQLLKLRLIERNDDTVVIVATRDSVPIPLVTGVDLELYLKTTEYQADAEATVLTSLAGQIEVIDETAGIAEATIDGSLITSDLTFWRVDVLETGARSTLLHGTLEVANI